MMSSGVERGGKLILGQTDPQLRRVVRDMLAGINYHVVEAVTARAALRLVETCDVELVLLDLPLPGMGEGALCCGIRRCTDAPIVVLTTRDDREWWNLLRPNVDAVVVKPFGMSELQAAVSQFRFDGRSGQWFSRWKALELGPIRIDFKNRRVTNDGQVVPLTIIEWELLRALAAAPGCTLTLQHLLQAVPGLATDHPERELRLSITRLRRKIEPDPSNPILVITEPSIGYRLALADARS